MGDLSPAERDETVVHLDSCTSCQVRVGEMKEQAELELDRLRPEEFVANLSVRMDNDVRRVSRFRRWAAVSAAAAMAAAAALILAPRPNDVIALRGSGLQVHRNRDGIPKLMVSGDRIQARDALRIVVTLPHPERVDAWSLDSTGRVDRLLATPGSMQLSAGEHVLPGSGIVNTPCYDGWIVVGLGDAASASTEAALKRLGPGPRNGDDWVPKGCLSHRLLCE